MDNILFGDSRVMLKQMLDESVDLTITSPPYKNSDGYSVELITQVFSEVYRVQRPDTLLFLNFGHLAEDKFRPFAVCKLLLDIGFKLNDTITWVKNHYRPIQGHKRLNNLTEFIFLLYKGNMPVLNRLAVGIPYADKSNAKRFNSGQDLRCAGNVWHIGYETITDKSQKLHNDRFPLELPERCIKLCGYPVNLVLDPFCGSGTTCLAAKKQGCGYIGIEQSSEHYATAFHRLWDYDHARMLGSEGMKLL